ncbi:hypothetical protein B0T24DRAFT_372763 [Lasiosphaeria ovina]|uniref:Uncharacterized protein n=1 Tax=Lasiosphaeria ovina TaxID=92902 RepID=A0AAE0JYY2_9PEZI|nr:hypothetical protein B0T24DRAFT_372763 [Lasiosphaeria ovina]
MPPISAAHAHAHVIPCHADIHVLCARSGRLRSSFFWTQRTGRIEARQERLPRLLSRRLCKLLVCLCPSHLLERVWFILGLFVIVVLVMVFLTISPPPSPSSPLPQSHCYSISISISCGMGISEFVLGSTRFVVGSLLSF